MNRKIAKNTQENGEMRKATLSLKLCKRAGLEANVIAEHWSNDELGGDAHLIGAQLAVDLQPAQDERQHALLLHQRESLA